MVISILLLCLVAPLLHCFEYEYGDYEYEYDEYEYQDYENEVYQYQEYKMDEDPPCLDDNTAYYGNSLKIFEGYNSSSECQMYCDKFL